MNNLKCIFIQLTGLDLSTYKFYTYDKKFNKNNYRFSYRLNKIISYFTL